MSLNGKRVIVIGGTSGIGLAVARQSAAAGALVTVGSSSQDRVDAAIRELPEGSGGVQVDVTDEQALREFFRQAGEFDHLSYTAGEALLLRPMAELTSAEARTFFEIRTGERCWPSSMRRR